MHWLPGCRPAGRGRGTQASWAQVPPSSPKNPAGECLSPRRRGRGLALIRPDEPSRGDAIRKSRLPVSPSVLFPWGSFVVFSP